MPITSMLFLFLFLPLSLALYYMANDKAKEYVLLVISIVFYALGTIQYILIFVIVIMMTILLGRGINY